MRRSRDIGKRAHCRRHHFTGGHRIEAEDENRLLRLRSRQCLDRDVGQRRQRPPGAGHEFAKIVAGDVLDHAAARFERLAAAGNSGKAEEMIAGRAGFDPTRAGQIGGDRAADRACTRRTVQQRAVIHRFERELLALFRDERVDLRERRAGFGGQHQFFRLVQRDTGKPGEIERRIPLRGAADRTLGAAANQFEGFALRQCPSDRFFDLFRLARPQWLTHATPSLQHHHSAAAAASASDENDGMTSRAKR